MRKENQIGLTLLTILLYLVSSISWAQSSLLDRGNLGGGRNSELLAPHEAFNPELYIESVEDGHFRLLWSVNNAYYLYKNKIDLSILNQNIEIERLTFPPGVMNSDEYFGTQEIYDTPFAIDLYLTGPLDEVKHLHLLIEAQGCAKSGFCYAPHEWKIELPLNPHLEGPDRLKSDIVGSAQVELPPVSEHDRLLNYLISKQYLAIPLFFLLGLLLTFTPCVLPMLPILSGILTNAGTQQGEQLSVRQGFTISLVYVLAMAAVYTLLGVLAAHLGKGLAAYLQHPYVLTGFSLIFVLLALSMFDLYQLQMPAAIQSKLNALSSKQQSKRSYSGIAIMGMLSALIVGPCVTAPLIGIISLIAQTQNYLLGATALFSMSMGMGLPLLILGASSGHLLPKAGAWMNQVKMLFGFMLLGLAAYFFGRTLDHYWEQMLYATIAIATFIWLVRYLAQEGRGVLFFGALAIATFLFSVQSINEAQRPIDLPLFHEVKGIDGLNTQLKLASGKITMLNFTADWCVNCKEMDKYLFSRDDVKTAMAPLDLLITDITKNDVKDQQLLRHFELYGPPALLFFDRNGRELEEYRIVGTIQYEEFIQWIEHLLEHN